MLNQPPPSTPVQTRNRVRIEYLDGTTEEVEAPGPVQVGPGVILVPQAREGMIILNLQAIKRCESVPSAIAVVRGAN